jgi:bifunctional non-homologous end joining protein LigD
MSTTPQPESVTLYFTQGSSDKVYFAEIVAQGGGFAVNFAYGRRGTTLQTGTKTPGGPPPYDAAKKIYDKLVAEKTAKGYSPGATGTPYQNTNRESRATGIFPQLLNVIDEREAFSLLADPDWAMQEKYDGKRILVRKTADGAVEGINRKGLIVALPETVAKCVAGLPGGSLILDGESIGDAYHAFDLLEQEGTDLRPSPLRLRLAALGALLAELGKDAPVQRVETVVSEAGKQAFLSMLRKRKAEGAVYKRLDAPYSAGRPSGGGGPALKLKFTATASCLVSRVNAGKRSVALELLDGQKRVAIGNVTIPANQPIPAKGDTVEVKYLYAYAGGSLYQPVFLGKRDDIVAASCTVSQLKFKAGDSDAENGENRFLRRRKPGGADESQGEYAMDYEAVLIDPLRGHHRRGIGPSPARAATEAFRRVLRFELPDCRQGEADTITEACTLKTFAAVAVEDEFYQHPRPFTEGFDEMRILVKVDKDKANLYTPCGWIRPLL